MKHLVVAAMATMVGAWLEGAPAQSRVFVGSTPCGDSIRALLGVPRDVKADLIEWELTLNDPGNAGAPSTYDLRYRVGMTLPNQPGLGSAASRLERRGTWRTGTGIRSQPAATVVELDGAVALVKVSDTILHVLEPDRTLMVGDGGWSYTLSRRDAAERAVDAALAAADSGDGPRTTSRATGPSVFGIFDGRTPCQGIARELRIPARPGCWKAKWRVTLFHDPKTHEPTTYRLEGTLYGRRPREGSWRIVKGIPAHSDAEVYELAAGNGEAPALLLKGDDRVLFFLDRERRPLTGNAGNAYTLDRREP